MARDPQVQHEVPVLRDGLRRVQGGDDLAESSALREELLHLCLLRVDHQGVLQLTREGRDLLRDDDR